MSDKLSEINSSNKLIVHQVNIAHVRLVELTKLADQAKPFYDWIERMAKDTTKSAGELNEIIFFMNKEEVKRLLVTCYNSDAEKKPLLFDGAGRTYPHSKGCFYFFSWMIRDAPQQRLAPLISKMRKLDSSKKLTHQTAEIDSLAELIITYRNNVKSFKWEAVREVVVDRLEGSRRSISGHLLEASIRTSLATAIQNYFSIHMNYGVYKEIQINSKQIKIGQNTIDVSAKLIGDKKTSDLFIPVKTRETQGGGHSYLFSRDIITAITNIKEEFPNSRIAVVIVSENWDKNEIQTILDKIDVLFHFNMNPNELTSLDEQSQRKINMYIEKVLSDEY